MTTIKDFINMPTGMQTVMGHICRTMLPAHEVIGFKEHLAKYKISLDNNIAGRIYLKHKNGAMVPTTLLEIAASKGYGEIMKSLLIHGATQDKATLNNAVIETIKRNDKELTKFLIQCGAEQPNQDQDHIAFYQKCLAVLNGTAPKYSARC